jgi:hypothetical protein
MGPAVISPPSLRHALSFFVPFSRTARRLNDGGPDTYFFSSGEMSTSALVSHGLAAS